MCERLAAAALVTMLTTFGFAFAPDVMRADPARDVALSVRATPELGCSDARHLRELVETRIGSPMFSDADDVQRVVEIQIRAAEGGIGFSATLVLRDAEGRTLGDREVSTRAASCDSLDPMLVLVISTLIGPMALPPLAAHEEAHPSDPADHRRHRSSRDPESNVTEAEARSACETLVLSESAPPSPPLQWALGLSAQALSGLLPDVAPSLTIDLWMRRASLELRAKIAATPRIQMDLGSGAHAGFLAILGQAQACGIATERLGGPLSFCAGAAAGGLSAQTYGLLQNEQSLRPVVLLALSATLQLFFLRHQALLLGGGVHIPLLAPSYYIWERANERRDFHAVELGAFAEFGWLWRFSS